MRLALVTDAWFPQVNGVVWSRGVDSRTFCPEAAVEPGLVRPLFLFVGRLAPEKNIEAFLDLDLPGTNVVVGDRPDRARLESDWPDAVFPGYRHGAELAAWYASADVFVFPSRTDTYGVVMLESSVACGTPVAAYPVTGPTDVRSRRGHRPLDDDLARAARACLRLARDACVAHAHANDWRQTAAFFLAHTMRRSPRPRNARHVRPFGATAAVRPSDLEPIADNTRVPVPSRRVRCSRPWY